MTQYTVPVYGSSTPLSGFVDTDVFGGIYISYNNLRRFDTAAQEMGLTSVRWPGGTLAEQRPDRYGYDYPDFYNPETGKPGLTEMMDYARSMDASFSMILPVTHFGEDEGALRTAVADFMVDLLGGGYGEFPREMTLEIGNEYYAQPMFKNAPELYGRLASAVAEEIALALADSAINPDGLEVNMAVQAGKGAEDDAAIRAQMSDYALSEVDEVVCHRFGWTFEEYDDKASEVEDAMAAWTAEIAAAGGEAPTLYLSGWNVASLTRQEALTKYVEMQDKYFGVEIDPESIDLEGRTDTAFEQFWQSGLLVGPYGEEIETNKGMAGRDYGLAQARVMIESMATYLELGMERAAIYGVDIGHGGHLSDRFDTFVATDMMTMMSESLVGTTLVSSAPENLSAREPAVYTFQDEDKTVIFAAAGDIQEAVGQTLSFDLSQWGDGAPAIWVESLRSDLPDNWMEIYGIPDNPDVDEAPEGRNYETGVRSREEVEIVDGTLRVGLDQDHQVVRIVIAHSEEAVAKIEAWAGEAGDLYPYLPEGGTMPFRDLVLDGGSGDDLLTGNGGNDKIHGFNGNDTLEGGAGNDVLIGGAGNDKMRGGAGADWMKGGLGDDIYVVGHTGDRVIEEKNVGDDLVYSSIDFVMRDHSQYIEDLVLTGADDIDAIGNGRWNMIRGNEGNNRIDGAWGDDELHGGAGDDIFDDARGNDRIWGDAGADSFVLDEATGYDRVFDFEDGLDHIALTNGNRFEDVEIYDVRGDAVVRLEPGHQIKLIGIDADLITVDDFLFL